MSSPETQQVTHPPVQQEPSTIPNSSEPLVVPKDGLAGAEAKLENGHPLAARKAFKKAA